MNPSEVRKQILAEHERLRARLRDIEATVQHAAAGDVGAAATIRRQLGELLAALRSHVRAEEAALVPALAATDAWGPERAAQIQADHVTQLRVLASWDRAVGDDGMPMDELAARLRQFAGQLWADMEAEERDLLHPDLLRDDVVTIGQSSS